MKKTCILAFGSNEANAPEIFQGALALLVSAGWEQEKFSSVIKTAPVNCVPGTPDFYNAAARGKWGGAPMELLHLTQSIERHFGRPDVHRSDQARPLDIDIILLGEEKISMPELIIPHPRAYCREFVLQPMQEIAPELLTLLH